MELGFSAVYSITSAIVKDIVLSQSPVYWGTETRLGGLST